MYILTSVLLALAVQSTQFYFGVKSDLENICIYFSGLEKS